MNIAIAALQVLVGIGIIVFWIAFFRIQNRNPTLEEFELKHEKSFPIPDLGWIVPCLFVAAAGLLMDHKLGYFFTAVSGSSLVFLGLLDFTFHFQNHRFNDMDFNAIVTFAVNGALVISGPILMAYSWFNI
jgi:hypothetical protein